MVGGHLGDDGVVALDEADHALRRPFRAEPDLLLCHRGPRHRPVVRVLEAQARGGGGGRGGIKGGRGWW